MTIETRAVDVLRKHLDQPWITALQAQVGAVPDLARPDTLLEPLPTLDRSKPLLADFSLDGVAWLRPGDPAQSLLFHVLAMPRDPASGPAGLDPAGLDDLENYIYFLGSGSSFDCPTEELVLATLAYAYRPAAATSHRRHADLVYSRTAITRVGTRPAAFSPAEQAWAHWSGSQFNVTRARMGVFLCRRVSGAITDISLLSKVDGDEARVFLLPVRKVFPGAAYHGLPRFYSITWHGHFRSDKLRRVVDYSGTEAGAGQDIDSPPFIVESTQTATAGGAGANDGKIELQPLAAAVLVGPCERIALVAPAITQVSGVPAIATIRVPARSDPILGLLRSSGLDSGNFSWNRHYTSLVLKGSSWRYAFEGAAEALEHTFPSWLYPLPKFRPRPAPEFVNIRHRVRGGQLESLSITLGGNYEQVLDEGDYQAALFDDGMFDGAVWAMVDANRSLAAFAVVTAPDFFPQADQADLEAWSAQSPDHNAVNQFREGGPMPLSAGRFAPNLDLTDPGSGRPLFTACDDTAVAIVGRPAAAARGARKPTGLDYLRKHGSGFLPDTASNEFAPGWDVTYDERDGVYFYTTHGLGSPFPEDVKFCASAAAYWPAASPDAARTFQRPKIGTAIPLLDEELGLHPARPNTPVDSPAGWDGEFGPFFEWDDEKLGVNFADIRRSDYVANALRVRDAFGSRIFALSSNDLVQRMEALRLIVSTLPGTPTNVESSPFWLVGMSQGQNVCSGFAKTLVFEFCLADDVDPKSRPTAGLQPSAPGYWRLWQAVHGRVKSECAFRAADDVVPSRIRQCTAPDARDSNYSPWVVVQST